MQLFLTNTWAAFVHFIDSTPFLYYGFSSNVGIWMHLIGAALLAKFIRKRFSFWQTFWIIIGIAIAWELIEIYIETPNWARVIEIYGTKVHYFYDTAGDIIAAGIITLIANLEFNKK